MPAPMETPDELRHRSLGELITLAKEHGLITEATISDQAVTFRYDSNIEITLGPQRARLYLIGMLRARTSDDESA